MGGFVACLLDAVITDQVEQSLLSLGFKGAMVAEKHECNRDDIDWHVDDGDEKDIDEGLVVNATVIAEMISTRQQVLCIEGQIAEEAQKEESELHEDVLDLELAKALHFTESHEESNENVALSDREHGVNCHKYDYGIV